MSEDAASTGQTIRVNGVNTYYEDYGSGPPLILLRQIDGAQ